ncbi:DUF4349 domain-containing protein [Halopelagius longus]|uniref:DUF4349 domain-containing protein n=1 Tax=Halopelagius longus TaxID=1236180 RepID=A0A1H1AI18_9EURY|nr:DUF4349 domain-containing protein [Halopelagius longus]RDI70373.1 DUF4349 domain-containing protein [Halopelagius longus]SDQ38866.1 protein of unknown function [Halopelagius longus]
MHTRRTLAAVALAALLVLAGCGGASTGGAGDSGEIAAERQQSAGSVTGAQATASGDDGASGGSDGGSASEAALQERALIKTGTVVVEVDDFESSRANLTDSVEGYGGFVSETRTRRRGPENHTYVHGTLVLRVPSEEYESLLSDAEAEGDVVSSETNTEDVTDQLVDLEARLENLRAERDRLRTLYERANSTEDVLAVQRELSDVQGEIERLEAKKKSLERRVAYSTLTVELREPDPTPTYTHEAWYDTPVVSAFLQSVEGVLVVGRAMVVGAAYALPYLFAFGAPVAVLGAAAWRFRHRLPR